MPKCIYCGEDFDTRQGMKIHQGQTHEGEQPRYEELHPPDPYEKDKDEYSTLERRADLFHKWFRKGSWSRINQMDQAEKYDVHPTAISRDKRVLQQYVLNNEELQQEIRARSIVGYQTIADKAMSGGDYNSARKALDSLNEFLERRGKEENQAAEGDTNIMIDNREVKVNLTQAIDDNLDEAREKIARGEWPGIEAKGKDGEKKVVGAEGEQTDE